MVPDGDAPRTVSLGARLGIAALMFLTAVLVSALRGTDASLGAVLVSFAAAPIFPLGLLFLVHPSGVGGLWDVVMLVVFVLSYALYGGVLVLVLKAKGMDSFLLVCLLFAVLLALNVKGCEAARETRWFSS